MSGAVVVEGLGRQVPEVGSLRQHLLVLRDEQVVPDIMRVPWYARQRTLPMEEALAHRVGIKRYSPVDPDDAKQQTCAPERGFAVTVEGSNNGALAIASGERQLLRVLNASGGRVFDLEVPGEKLGLVAMDGYPLNSYPGTPDVLWMDHIVLPPGGRAEFLVTGQQEQSVLRSRCYDSGPAGDLDPAVILARLQPSDYEGAKSPMDAPISEAAAQQRDPIALTEPAQRRTILFSEDTNGYHINHRRFDMQSMDPMVTVRSGTVEEWTVENDTDEVHSFHIHQVHFVVERLNGLSQTPRYWRDTVLIPPQRHTGTRVVPGRVTLLVDFRNPAIKGTFPFHCHMLDHEDGGMMALVRVI